MKLNQSLLIAVALLFGTLSPGFAAQVTGATVTTAKTTTTATTSTSTQQASGTQGGPGGGPNGGQKGGDGGGLKAACQNDDEKVCPGVLAAHGNIVECLKAHIASVSEQCRVALQNMKEPPKGGQQGEPQGGPPPSNGQGGQGGGQPPAPPSGTTAQ